MYGSDRLTQEQVAELVAQLDDGSGLLNYVEVFVRFHKLFPLLSIDAFLLCTIVL
jgi:hypothetical protein